MLHDNYLCLVESNKQQIEKARSKIQAESSETRATSKRVCIRPMHSASVAFSSQEDKNEEIKMFINFFSHASLSLVIFAHAPPSVPSKDCCSSPPKKSQRELLDIYQNFRLISYIISRSYPKFFSEGRPQLSYFLKICRPNLHHVIAIKVLFKLLFDQIF